MDFPIFSPEAIVEAIVSFLPRLGLGIAVVLIARLFSIWSSRILKRSMDRREVDEELIVLLQMLTRWGIMAVGIVLALEQIAPGRFGSLIAGLGIAGFTLGFALQDVAKNFIAGLLLLLQRPFDLGDLIEVSGFTGRVQNISLRATDIITLDGLHVIIPNGEVFVNSIKNFTKAKQRRLELTLWVSFSSDLGQVIRVSMDTLGEIDEVLKAPSPLVALRTIQDGSVSLSILFWVDSKAVILEEVTNTVMEKVLDAYERDGIEVPTPTMSINILTQGNGNLLV